MEILGFLSILLKRIFGDFTEACSKDSLVFLAWGVGFFAYLMILTQLLVTWYVLKGLHTGSM
jgi:hypothetical protein